LLMVIQKVKVKNDQGRHTPLRRRQPLQLGYMEAA
jgi:hypothetical protein